MIFDKENLFSNAQAVTDSQASTNIIDLGVSRDIGHGRAIEVAGYVGTTVLSGGSSTVNFLLQTDTQSSFATSVTLYQTGAIAKATLVAGYKFMGLKLPEGVQRYLRLYYTLATADLTTGTFTAGLLLDRQQLVYPTSGLRVSGF